MIDLYAWNTPNGRKITIMLEEAELDYKIHLVNLEKKEQFAPEFLKISPNNKIPAIVDNDAPGDPIPVFESGAILLHLADKAQRLIAPSGAERADTLQWLFWQTSGFAPMLGQFNNAIANAEKMGTYGVERFTNEAIRLFGVLDRRLSETEFVGGKSFTIADVTTYPWVEYTHKTLTDQTGKTFEAVKSWQKRIALRPAVGRGMAALTV